MVLARVTSKIKANWPTIIFGLPDQHHKCPETRHLNLSRDAHSAHGHPAFSILTQLTTFRLLIVTNSHQRIPRSQKKRDHIAVIPRVRLDT